MEERNSKMSQTHTKLTKENDKRKKVENLEKRFGCLFWDFGQ